MKPILGRTSDPQLQYYEMEKNLIKLQNEVMTSLLDHYRRQHMITLIIPVAILVVTMEIVWMMVNGKFVTQLKDRLD